MGRSKSSPHIDLAHLFLRVQQQMLANLSASDVFDHPTACGAATEQHWLDLLNHYLPQRYRAASAFIVDADGRRSRQIDIAVYDRFYSPLLFHHDAGAHIPAEAVYAVFEVKQTLSSKWILDAGRKAASVRCLRRTSAPIPGAASPLPPKPPFPILAGVLSLDAVWKTPFPHRIAALLRRLPPDHRLDLGCTLRRGAFEVGQASARQNSEIRFSRPESSLIYFVLRLLHRLQQLGAAPAIDLSEYSKCLE